LRLMRGPFTANNPLQPSECWRYLGFYLDPALTFRHHITYYAQSARSTIQSMLMLGNSVRGLSPLQKRRLYMSCVLPLMTYGCQ
ncbi:hypothetical protein C8Q80DRAFT_1052908, partial [Daedaleopsis nitida]